MRSESQPTRSDFTPSNDGRPLVVDLDGTLIKSDLLVEAVFKRIGAKPFAAVGLLAALRRGKAHFKHVLAQAVNLDPASLPYDQVILGRIREAVAAGRPVYLASASNAQFVSAVAEHLGFFTGWFGSDAITNVAGSNKARLLVEAFGDGGFDYIGNDEADLHIWAVASKGMAVRPPSRIQAKLVAAGIEIIESEKQKLKSWIKLFRVHQYVKNTLVFLPLLTAQRLDPASIFDSVLAFLAFSLCASSVYIFNDLVDLAADRDHPTKCNRPLASGAISIIHAALAIPILLVVAMALAAFASLPFLAVMIFYFALTTTYTCWLKTKMLIDVVVLAMLYTLRAIGGAAAIGVPVSEWLLAFSMFIFTSLALIKRYVELTTRLDAAKCDPSNRNYRLADMPIVASCAAAAGFNAVTVFALYISSDTVHQLYHHPKALWLVCPVLMYWIARMLMMAHRRQMHDDPIVFAAKDPPSLWAVAAIGAIMLAAAA
ncbi:MAG: UbiA family prenyltransferase [Methylocella sp.]